MHLENGDYPHCPDCNRHCGDCECDDPEFGYEDDYLGQNFGLGVERSRATEVLQAALRALLVRQQVKQYNYDSYCPICGTRHFQSTFAECEVDMGTYPEDQYPVHDWNPETGESDHEEDY